MHHHISATKYCAIHPCPIIILPQLYHIFSITHTLSYHNDAMTIICMYYIMLYEVIYNILCEINFLLSFNTFVYPSKLQTHFLALLLRPLSIVDSTAFCSPSAHTTTLCEQTAQSQLMNPTPHKLH